MMGLLLYAAGIATGLWLPPLVAWVLTYSERGHLQSIQARRVGLDEMVTQTLGPPPVPQQQGRHQVSSLPGRD